MPPAILAVGAGVDRVIDARDRHAEASRRGFPCCPGSSVRGAEVAGDIRRHDRRIRGHGAAGQHVAELEVVGVVDRFVLEVIEPAGGGSTRRLRDPRARCHWSRLPLTSTLPAGGNTSKAEVIVNGRIARPICFACRWCTASSGRPRRAGLHGRQQQRTINSSNDRDHHQQLDQGEPITFSMHDYSSQNQ